MTATDDALRQAAGRLLAGAAPLRGDGALTVQNLAVEAGVSRASAYRSPVLVEFRQCVANPVSYTHLRGSDRGWAHD